MKLNHLNLTVTNVTETSQFLQKYFGLHPIASAADATKFAFLSDDNGMLISLLKIARPGAVTYPPTFHIGFMQESEERVNEINQCLKADGFDVQPPQRAHAWTFYVQAPGGFTVEVLC